MCLDIFVGLGVSSTFDSGVGLGGGSGVEILSVVFNRVILLVLKLLKTFSFLSTFFYEILFFDWFFTFIYIT